MEFKKIVRQMYRTLNNGAKMQDEVYWAQIYNNTVSNSSWLKNNNFSPGRWAVGYPFLYTMYRVLDEMHPKRILELGMGQTTKMIGQYVAYNSDVEHIVVEQDKDWIKFFTGISPLPTKSNVIHCDYEYVPYKSEKNVRIFSNFTDKLQDKSFDFICIDAPIGSYRYSRIDILNILPQCLSESFILMLDDYNRTGEQNTMREITHCLEQNGITYDTGVYHGEKDVVLLASENNKYFCSM